MQSSVVSKETVQPMDRVMFQSLARFIGLVEEKLNTSPLAEPAKQFKAAIDKLAKNTEASLQKTLDDEAFQAFAKMLDELKKAENMRLIEAQCTYSGSQAALGKIIARPLTFPKNIQSVASDKYRNFYEGIKKAIFAVYRAQVTSENPFDLVIQQQKADVLAAQKPAGEAKSVADIYRQMTGRELTQSASTPAPVRQEQKLSENAEKLFNRMAAFWELIFNRNLEHIPAGNGHIRNIKAALFRLIQTMSEKKDGMAAGDNPSKQMEKLAYVLTGPCLKWIREFLDTDKIPGNVDAQNVLALADLFIIYIHSAVVKRELDKRYADLKDAIVEVCKFKSDLDVVSADDIRKRLSERADVLSLKLTDAVRGPSLSQVASDHSHALSQFRPIARDGGGGRGETINHLVGVEAKLAKELFDTETGMLLDAFNYLRHGTKATTIAHIQTAMEEMYKQISDGVLPVERPCVDILENFAMQPFDPFDLDPNHTEARRYAVHFMVEYRMMKFIKTTREHALPLTDTEEREKIQLFATETITSGFQNNILNMQLAREACTKYNLPLERIPGLSEAIAAEEASRAHGMRMGGAA